jgi:predicted RNase H-like HicB family nuclease
LLQRSDIGTRKRDNNSQEDALEEAMDNVKEAIELYHAKINLIPATHLL